MTTTSVPAAPPEQTRRSRLAQTARRMGWGVADQGVSSLTNFALGLYAAHTLHPSSFGAFSLAFVTSSVVLNASRGLATDPFMVRFSGTTDDRWKAATSSATGSALAVGLVAGILCVAVGLLLPGAVGPAYVALGLALPALVLQDSWRFAFFAAGRGAASFVNDLVMAVVLVSALLVLHLGPGGTPQICLLVLGGAAAVGAVLGGVQARVLPRPGRIVPWLRTHRHLSFRYFLENVSISGAGQIRSFVLGAVVGLAAVGYVRASEILMGPVFVLLSGLSQVAVPEATRVFARDAQELRRFGLGLGGAQAVVAVGWGVVLMTIFPLGPGRALIDELWEPTQALLPAITATLVAVALSNGAASCLRAMGVARRSLRAQLIGSSAYLVCACTGAVLGGALGASWGTAIGSSISAAVWWGQLRAALADHVTTPADPVAA